MIQQPGWLRTFTDTNLTSSDWTREEDEINVWKVSLQGLRSNLRSSDEKNIEKMRMKLNPVTTKAEAFPSVAPPPHPPSACACVSRLIWSHSVDPGLPRARWLPAAAFRWVFPGSPAAFSPDGTNRSSSDRFNVRGWITLCSIRPSSLLAGIVAKTWTLCSATKWWKTKAFSYSHNSRDKRLNVGLFLQPD